jgi:hypothetical protein
MSKQSGGRRLWHAAPVNENVARGHHERFVAVMRVRDYYYSKVARVALLIPTNNNDLARIRSHMTSHCRHPAKFLFNFFFFLDTDYGNECT